MIKKITVIFIALAFVLSAVAMTFADRTAEEKETAQAPQLASLLPASDGIMTVDVKRLLDQALPQMLSANQPKLAKIFGELDRLKAQTGFDIRRFEQVAVGVKTNRKSATEIDFEPVLLARGAYEANGLVGLAKIASKGKYRAEKVGERTIYIFSVKELVEDNKPKTKGKSLPDKAFDKMFKNLNREIAVTDLDRSTLVLGTPERVRETLGARSRVNGDLLDLVYRNQNAVVSFGMNMPQGMSGFFEIGNPEIDANIDAIRQLYGSLDVAGGNTLLSATARTDSAAKAESLGTLLSGLKELGELFLGSAKGADKQVYVRLIRSSQISQADNEVMFDLEIRQSDLDILIGEKK